jgi:hypothetical protein
MEPIEMQVSRYEGAHVNWPLGSLNDWFQVTDKMQEMELLRRMWTSCQYCSDVMKK